MKYCISFMVGKKFYGDFKIVKEMLQEGLQKFRGIRNYLVIRNERDA